MLSLPPFSSIRPCGTFQLLPNEKHYSCSIQVPALSNATVTTCKHVVASAFCNSTRGVRLAIIAPDGNQVAVSQPDERCGGCGSVLSLENGDYAPATYVVRASCAGAACLGAIEVASVPLQFECPYALLPGEKDVECAVTVAAGYQLLGQLDCYDSTATLAIVSPDGSTSEYGCGGVAYQIFDERTLELRRSCDPAGYYACSGTFTYALVPLPPSCPPFSLERGKKAVLCFVEVPSGASLLLSSVCWPTCVGSTTVSVTAPTGATHASGIACVGPCTYMAYNNTASAPVLVNIHQTCVPALQSACSGRTAYQLA